MAFVRTKVIKGTTYYYLVEGYRQDGKVRQKVLSYLGKYPTVKLAISYWKDQEKTATNRSEKALARNMIEKLKPYL